MSYDLQKAIQEHATDVANSTPRELTPGETMPTNSTKDAQPNQNVNHKQDGNIDPRIVNNAQPFQSIQKLAELIERTGLPVKWERSFVCPCMSSGGHPKTDCPICHGLGTGFREPLYLQMAIQADNRSLYQGAAGNQDTGILKGTPQITENGIENGIAPRDRISVDGLTLTQNYYFNVTQKRVDKGMYIPYYVKKIIYIVTISQDGSSVKELQEGLAYEFDSDKSMFYPKASLLGKNISLVLDCHLRMYVTNIAKETRYAQVDKQNDKQVLFQNNDNAYLTNYAKKYDKAMQPGTIYVRMPKLLILRREDLFLGNLNFSDTSKNKSDKSEYLDTKAKMPKMPNSAFSDMDV